MILEYSLLNNMNRKVTKYKKTPIILISKPVKIESSVILALYSRKYEETYAR